MCKCTKCVQEMCKCTKCLPNQFLVCLANILTCQESVPFIKEKIYIVTLTFRQTSPRLALRAKCRVHLALLIKLSLCRPSEPCKESPSVFRKQRLLLLKYFLFAFCYFLLQFTWLPNEIGVYDLIVMLSLQRLSNPKGKKFWVIIRFWETAHLPLPQANMNNKGKMLAKGGGGGGGGHSLVSRNAGKIL